MQTDTFVRALNVAHAARAAANRRRRLDAEFKELIAGGTLVITGLLLAAIYCLLTHQLSV